MSSKYKNIVFKDCSEFCENESFRFANEYDKHTVLEVIKNKLSVKESFFKLDSDILEEEKTPLLNRPYESFLRKPEWTAGLYVGEAVVNLDYNNDKLTKKSLSGTYKLVIKPRFGEHFIIHMLEEIYHFKMPKSDTNAKTEKSNWTSLLKMIMIKLWCIKLAKANQYGLPRKTETHVHQGYNVRGQLDIEKSLLPYHIKGEVVSNYFEKEMDDSIGKIIYQAYRILWERNNCITSLPPQVRDTINTLHERFSGMQIRLTRFEYERIQYKRVYESWKPIVDFSWQIICNYVVNPHETDDKRGYAYFFDISEIWESYIASIIKNKFRHCTRQNSNYNLFDFGQRIIPDYISRDMSEGEQSTKRIVGDAKYMKLYKRTTLENEQLYSVYYKTIMYMYRFNCGCGYIFYPHLTDEEGITSVDHSIQDTSGKLYMIGLHIPKQEDNYDEWSKKMKKNEEVLHEQFNL